MDEFQGFQSRIPIKIEEFCNVNFSGTWRFSHFVERVIALLVDDVKSFFKASKTRCDNEGNIIMMMGKCLAKNLLRGHIIASVVTFE